MIKIYKKQLEELIEQAGQILPQESCGVFAGIDSTVQKIYKMKNTSDQPETCYCMDPTEQLKVMKEIRKHGLEMLGIYHSHPGSSAYPSKRDVELAFYPNTAYVILSFESKDRPMIRAFRIIDAKISDMEIKIV